MAQNIPFIAFAALILILGFSTMVAAETGDPYMDMINRLGLFVHAIDMRLNHLESKVNYTLTFGQLHDGPIGHSKGWNPNGKTFSFDILEPSVRAESVITVTVIDGKTGCSVRTLFVEEGFKIHCSDDVAKGATLNYAIMNPDGGSQTMEMVMDDSDSSDHESNPVAEPARVPVAQVMGMK